MKKIIVIILMLFTLVSLASCSLDGENSSNTTNINSNVNSKEVLLKTIKNGYIKVLTNKKNSFMDGFVDNGSVYETYVNGVSAIEKCDSYTKLQSVFDEEYNKLLNVIDTLKPTLVDNLEEIKIFYINSLNQLLKDNIEASADSSIQNIYSYGVELINESTTEQEVIDNYINVFSKLEYSIKEYNSINNVI